MNSSIRARIPRKFQIGMRSSAFNKSSNTPIAPPTVFRSTNGVVQISKDAKAIGLLIQRDGKSLGTILTRAQARRLSRLLA